MRDASVDGLLVPAGENSPEEAVCPSCGGAVKKRKRRGMGGQVTYFYRHVRGVGDGCPQRYRPVP